MRVRFVLNAQSEIDAALQAFDVAIADDTQTWQCVLEPAYKRTAPQLRRYFGLLRHISHQTGDDIESLHHWYVTHFLGLRPIARGKRVVIERVSTGDTAARDWGEYIEAVTAHAALFFGVRQSKYDDSI